MTGRPTSYTPEIAASICQLVAEGGNLDRIAQEEAMPSKTTIYSWLKTHETFANEYAQARTMRADSRSDRIDDYGRQLIAGDITAEQARVLIDIEKWQAGKENPKKFGDRVALNHGGQEGENPIKADATVTLTPDEAYRRMLNGDS